MLSHHHPPWCFTCLFSDWAPQTADQQQQPDLQRPNSRRGSNDDYFLHSKGLKGSELNTWIVNAAFFSKFMFWEETRETMCLDRMWLEASRANIGLRWMSDGPGPSCGCVTSGKWLNLSGPQCASYKVRVIWEVEELICSKHFRPCTSRTGPP